MQKLTSKQVVAIGITPRINTFERDQIQELIDGTHPLSSYRKTEDSGARRKVFLEQSPAGPNETGGAGDRTSHDNVGSGYDKGLDPGGRADDEVGPGNTPNRDPEQEFTSPDTVNQIFGNEGDLSEKFSPLNADSNKRDMKITDHLRRLQTRPTPAYALPKRHPVDERRKAASSNWTRKFEYNMLQGD